MLSADFEVFTLYDFGRYRQGKESYIGVDVRLVYPIIE